MLHHGETPSLRRAAYVRVDRLTTSDLAGRGRCCRAPGSTNPPSDRESAASGDRAATSASGRRRTRRSCPAGATPAPLPVVLGPALLGLHLEGEAVDGDDAQGIALG